MGRRLRGNQGNQGSPEDGSRCCRQRVMLLKQRLHECLLASCWLLPSGYRAKLEIPTPGACLWPAQHTCQPSCVLLAVDISASCTKAVPCNAHACGAGSTQTPLWQAGEPSTP